MALSTPSADLPPPDLLSKYTLRFVLASLTAAVIVEAMLMAEGWPVILPATLAALVAFPVVSWRYPRVAAAAVLLLAYVVPVIPFLFRGRVEFGTATPWVAALIGVMAPRTVQHGWAIPARWRTPLMLWGLTVALTWPIVALREADFRWITLSVPRLSVTGLPGVPPSAAIMWSLDVALVLGVGILWFNWLYATFQGSEQKFRTTVIGALAASWLVTTAIGIYQLLVDVTFLNSGMFGFLKRASGLMFDANPFGIVAALGIPAIAAVAFVTSWRGKSAAVGVVLMTSWLALWGSGSKTAFATGAIGTLFVLYYAANTLARIRSRRSWWVPVTGVVLLLSAVTLFVLPRVSAVGTLQRFREASTSLTLKELWNRNGYGLTATRIIGEQPAVGIGVGAFHYLVLDFSREAGVHVPGDNAQNWYRHQLAEFGILGSVGWIWWTLSFGWFALTGPVATSTRAAAGAIRGALIAIAAISLLGMPTQNIAITLTFWTLAFWYLLLAGEPGRVDVTTPRAPARTWIGIAVLIALTVAGTIWSARDDLRVPFRAARFGWPYAYGWHPPESGAAGEFQWAGREAVRVLDAAKPWIRISVSVNHADVTRNPVLVKIWCDGEEVLAATLADSQQVVRYAQIRDRRPRVVLESWVSRVVRPADYGVPDPRELGVMVQWEFVDGPSVVAGR